MFLIFFFFFFLGSLSLLRDVTCNLLVFTFLPLPVVVVLSFLLVQIAGMRVIIMVTKHAPTLDRSGRGLSLAVVGFFLRLRWWVKGVGGRLGQLGAI